MSTVLGRSISEQEKVLLSLPAQMGGMRIQDPIESAHCAYTTSRDSRTTILASIKGEAEFSIQTHNEKLARADVKLRGEQKISD